MPSQVLMHDAGDVRWYVDGDGAFAVVFERDRAIAARYPHRRQNLQQRDLVALAAHAAGTQPVQIYVADSGVIITTQHCPRSLVELLAAVPQPGAGKADAR